MKIKKVEMISNAISENKRYLPSASVRKLYNFMIDKKYIDEDNLIKQD